MLFSYKAKSKTGEMSSGTMEAQNRFAISNELRNRGFTPLSIKEKGKGIDFSTLSDKFFSKVKAGELIIMTKNLSGMIKAGLSLFRALSVLQKQTKKRGISTILNSVSTEINSG